MIAEYEQLLELTLSREKGKFYIFPWWENSSFIPFLMGLSVFGHELTKPSKLYLYTRRFLIPVNWFLHTLEFPGTE